MQKVTNITAKTLTTTPRDVKHPCGECRFFDGGIWQPVAARSVSALVRGFSHRELEAKEILYAQDEENSGVYCVSKGLIALRVYHTNGRSTFLKLAYPGDVIGIRSFLRNGRHKTQARALLPSKVCTVAYRDAEKIVRANSSVLIRLASECVSEIDRCHDRIIATAHIPNKQRLADILHRLMCEHGKRTGDRMQMHLPLSRMDLADLIGVQPETMSRLFKKLQDDENLIASGRNISLLCDP